MVQNNVLLAVLGILHVTGLTVSRKGLSVGRYNDLGDECWKIYVGDKFVTSQHALSTS